MKDIFLEKKSFDNFFRPWVECFGVLSKICWRGCKNCFLRAHTNIFFKIFFLKNIVFYFSFWDRERRFFGISSKSFPTRCQNCILPLHRVILMRKTFGWKNLKVFLSEFETFSEIFLAVCWEIFGRFVAIGIYVFIRFLLREKIFVWKFYFFIISDSDRKNIELRQSIFGRVVKTAFYVCIRTFWQKLLSFWERYKLLSLSDLQRNFFRILSKIIGEVLKTAIYVSN